MIIDIKKIKESSEYNELGKAIKKEEDTILRIMQEKGQQELIEYQRLIDKFIKDIENLAVFKQVFNETVSDQIKTILIDEILYELIKPVFEGNIPPMMQNEIYNKIRYDMYRNLKSKYIYNFDDDMPF